MQIQGGATSKSIPVFIPDNTVSTGAGKTGITSATGSLVASYTRPSAAPVGFSLASVAVSGAYVSGGFVEYGSASSLGLYRLDIPNAAIASGADWAIIHLSSTASTAPINLRIDLVGWNPQSTAITASDISAAVLAAAAADPIAANVEEVNAIAVTGSGTTIDPWGP